MLSLILFLSCLCVALGVGVLSALSDMRGLTIPNKYSLIVILAFLAAYGGLWVLGGVGSGFVFFGPLSHALSALIVFVVTLVFFALRTLGAADSKLATAYALWVGLEGLAAFLVYMTLAGGVVALLSLIFKKWKPFKVPREGSWVARVQAGESKVPYGVAIFFGALVSFVKLGYVGRDVLGNFLSL